MWFDARARLAEIEADPPATIATTATRTPATPPVSQVSQVSQRPQRQTPAPRVASVASVATPQRPKLETACPAHADGLDPDAAALLEHIHTHGPTTYGAASLALRWGASRAWRAEAVLRARGLVRLVAQGRAELVDPPPL